MKKIKFSDGKSQWLIPEDKLAEYNEIRRNKYEKYCQAIKGTKAENYDVKLLDVPPFEFYFHDFKVEK